MKLAIVFGFVLLLSSGAFAAVCSAPAFLTSNTDVNLVEYKPQIQTNHIAWEERDYYGNSTNSLHLLDIGNDHNIGTADDIGPFLIDSDIKSGEFSLSQNFLTFIKPNNDVMYCSLYSGGCYPDVNGNQSFDLLLVPQTGERENLRADYSLTGQVHVWSEQGYLENPDRLVISAGSTPIFFYPLDSNKATFLPIVKNGIVIWTEIDEDENGLPNWVYVRYFNTRTNVHKILVSSSYHSFHPKVGDLVSYTDNRVLLAIHETPSLGYKYYTYNTLNDEMIKRGRINDIESYDFSFDNQKMGGILRQKSGGIMTNSLLYVARNLSTVLIDEAVIPNRISNPKVSEGIAVYSMSNYDANAGQDIQKIKFSMCFD